MDSAQMLLDEAIEAAKVSEDVRESVIEYIQRSSIDNIRHIIYVHCTCNACETVI